MPGSTLFDLDGTLIDSRPGILASMDAAVRALGHAPDPAFDLGFALGPPLEQAMAAILAHYHDTRVAEAITAYRRHYGAFGLFQHAVYDGIPALLEGLREAGWRLHLATSKRADFARTILARNRLARHFASIDGAEPGEDKPALLARILAQQTIPPAEAVMIGDRGFDMAGARANALPAIGVLWGYGSRAELEQAGAARLAATPAALAALLC